MPQILECRIGQEKYQKKGNLAPERGKKFEFLCLPPESPSSYDLSQSCRVVAHGTRDSYKEPPLPFWCSVRFPLIPLEFNVDPGRIQKGQANREPDWESGSLARHPALHFLMVDGD